MSYIHSIKRGICVLASMLFVAAAGAAPVSWSNSSGSATNFVWSNGANDNGLAGSPTTSGDFFLFFPSGLKATAANGEANGATDNIHVTLTPNAGLRITRIVADFHGDETVFGGLVAGYSAGLDAMKHSGGLEVNSFLSPPSTTSQAAFNDSLSLTIPKGFGAIDLTLMASVFANTSQGTTAVSEMKVMGLSVETAPNVVPLPAALVTFPIGAALVGFATRRMSKRAS